MTKQLYEEALADVKKLKEVAEDNAKRALLEAVTPRIRDLIENQLLGEASDDDKLLMDEFPEEVEEMPAVSAVPFVGGEDAAAAAISMPDEEGKVTLDLDALKVPGSEEYEISMESAKALGMLLSTGKDAVLEGKIRKIDRKVRQFASASRLVKESQGFADSLSSIISEVEDTYAYLQNSMQDSSRKKSYEELLEAYYKTLNQLTEQKMNKRNSRLTEADITLKLTGLGDDINLDDVGVDLITGDEGGEEPEGEEGEEGGEDDLDLGDEGDEEEGGEDEDELDLGDEDEEDEEESEEKMESRRLRDDLVVEIDEGMLRREIARMKSLREAADDVQKWGHGAGEVSDDFEDDDMGDPFVDIDLTTESEDKEEGDMGEVDMGEADDEEVEEIVQSMKQMQKQEAQHNQQDQRQDEADDEDTSEMAMEGDVEEAEDTEEYGGAREAAQTNKQSRQPGATVESLRRRLRVEARIQLEAKQKAQAAKKQAQKKQAAAKQKQAEAQQKAKQKRPMEAQKKKQEAQKQQKKANQMKEAFLFFAKRFNESVTRSNRLKGMLTEAVRKGSVLNGASGRSAAETNNLRAKLAETNLFNAKLLFTNKLLQNESLTKRQKAEVIERLDEARSEREVKLVYESLVKTLQGSTKLTESADRGVIGSSSRPARPASATNSLNEGFEADRWARLAGIVK